MSDMDHEVRSARMLGCEISTNPLDPLEPILKNTTIPTRT